MVAVAVLGGSFEVDGSLNVVSLGARETWSLQPYEETHPSPASPVKDQAVMSILSRGKEWNQGRNFTQRQLVEETEIGQLTVVPSGGGGGKYY